MKLTNKNLKKDIIRKEILRDYIELCMNTGHGFDDVLGHSLQTFNYNILLDRMVGMNDGADYTFIDTDTMSWYGEMIESRKL
mgnify:FL=1|tara:strand:+ start:1531 stop:1776 length:246 start_codon:yes stop_codon:yes gene_type:complete